MKRETKEMKDICVSGRLIIFLVFLVSAVLLSCANGDGSDGEESSNADDDDTENNIEEEVLQREKLEAMFKKMGFLPYLELVFADGRGGL